MTAERATTVFATDDLRVLDVRCRRRVGHVDEEAPATFELVVPTSGAFRRATTTGTAVIDAGCGYVAAPGTVHELAHVTHGDRCVAVLPSARLADETALDRMAGDRWAVPATALLHRRLTAALTARADDDELDVSHRWIAVVTAAVGQAAGGASTAARRQQRLAVERVREAVAADPGAGWTMRRLAEVAGYAPHHLSRVFRRQTAMTLSEYRDRVRLGRALELARDGMPLADVAAATGFCDHGHLTRRARHVLGVVPSALLPS